MKPALERQFEEFVAARSRPLLRTAYLLCGDWHLAEDLVQTALAKLYAVWHRVHDTESVEAYTRRVLVRVYVDTRRKRSSQELPSADIPDPGVPPGAGEDSARRLALLAALARVTPVYRAVLVLRFWEDQSVEETAALLGKSSAAVRSATTRGLEQLRRVLGESVHDIARA
ncbi:SigE family RNA polymerase sigma factor [Yinghuangia seranimata]|uniref:SigE family RNA polymerase sigma factor n=1 Tax=Yinghuangia seranimata TaxID=408067 RepID=UPI00248B48AF|nr:SigE family RNA polymerase sigma factor [Yinghuangia seranimata]MDI2125936.1 SigE family RNA polymerase sigma factor [Yinghuangia seranimata]